MGTINSERISFATDFSSEVDDDDPSGFPPFTSRTLFPNSTSSVPCCRALSNFARQLIEIETGGAYNISSAISVLDGNNDPEPFLPLLAGPGLVQWTNITSSSSD